MLYATFWRVAACLTVQAATGGHLEVGLVLKAACRFAITERHYAFFVQHQVVNLRGEKKLNAQLRC